MNCGEFSIRSTVRRTMAAPRSGLPCSEVQLFLTSPHWGAERLGGGGSAASGRWLEAAGSRSHARSMARSFEAKL